MNIPPLNISVTKAAINGRVVDVVDYDEYRKNINMYLEDKNDSAAIPVTHNNKELLLPIKGKYSCNHITPGVYNAGVMDIMVYPEEAFEEKYLNKGTVTMSNNSDIKDLIKAGDITKKMDEPFITTPDSITNIPIRENDQPEMKCLKMALNAKRMDIDKYAVRFGDNYPNDKRQLKSTSATLNIIKRFCNNCDMEAILILKDTAPDVPNPIGKEISISLTNTNFDDYATENANVINTSSESNEDETSEYVDD